MSYNLHSGGYESEGAIFPMHSSCSGVPPDLSLGNEFSNVYQSPDQVNNYSIPINNSSPFPYYNIHHPYFGNGNNCNSSYTQQFSSKQNYNSDINVHLNVIHTYIKPEPSQQPLQQQKSSSVTITRPKRVFSFQQQKMDKPAYFSLPPKCTITPNQYQANYACTENNIHVCKCQAMSVPPNEDKKVNNNNNIRNLCNYAQSVPPNIPNIPSIPNIPNMPNTPNLKSNPLFLPNINQIPNINNLTDLPKLLPIPNFKNNIQNVTNIPSFNSFNFNINVPNNPISTPVNNWLCPTESLSPDTEMDGTFPTLNEINSSYTKTKLASSLPPLPLIQRQHTSHITPISIANNSTKINTTKTIKEKPKRKRGRPKKNPLSINKNKNKNHSTIIKKKRGRPKKSSVSAKAQQIKNNRIKTSLLSKIPPLNMNINSNINHDKYVYTTCSPQRKNRIKNLECVYCHKFFATNYELTRHLRIHTGERPYKCTVCKKGFKQKQHMITHKKSVHENFRPFKCNICQKKFKEKGTLTKHIQYTHQITKNTVDCEYCSKSFKRKGNLKCHMKRIHGNMD